MIIASEKGGVNIEEGDPALIKTIRFEMPNSVENVP